MRFPNVKQGLNKLFAAEIMTIISGFSVAVNGDNLAFLGTALALLGTAAFVVSIIGLRQCAIDEKGYKRPLTLTVAAIFVCLGMIILGVVLKNSYLSDGANEVQGLFNFLVAYEVLKTTAKILRESGKEADAKYADGVRKLFTAAFVVAEVFGLIADSVDGTGMLIAAILTAVASIIALLIANIKYIIFLKRSADAL